MSHRRTLKTEWDEAFQKSQDLLSGNIDETFKSWLTKTIILNIVSVALCAVLYTFFKNDNLLIIIWAFLAFNVFTILITIHEFGHALIAHILGCKYKLFEKGYFSIPGTGKVYSSVQVEVEWTPNFPKNKKYVVALTPNIVLILIAVTCLIQGSLFFLFLGIYTIVGSIVATILDVKAV